MQNFEHINATTVAEAVSALASYKGKATVVAGGTDLIRTLRNNVLSTYPEAVINLKTIKGLDYIKEEGGFLKIGALARLDAIVNDATIKSKYQALASAAQSVGAWQLRVMGTLGGNLCQNVECWYYRYPNNQFNCLRKGGQVCYAIAGDNRYHSIFGATGGCVAVSPSDIAPALMAFGGKVLTSKRTLDAKDFFVASVSKTTSLGDDEIVTEVQLPTPTAGVKSAFVKFALRQAVDFPIVNCAAVITSSGGTVSAASIVLNAVAGAPRRATEAETALKGKAIDETNAQAAGDAAVASAVALTNNKYMVQIARTMVKRAVLACK